MKYTFLLMSLCVVISCRKDKAVVEETGVPVTDHTHQSAPIVFDLPPDSAPHFVNVSYIDLSKISRISRLRSGIGHDYSDDFEFCRSMKHYFDPGIHASDTINIYSPVKGTIVRMFQEWAGYQLQVKSDLYPAFTFILFHVNIFPGITEGSSLTEGQFIGHHIGSMTMSDIAVAVNTSGDGPKPDSTSQKGMRLFSLFHVMSDSLLQVFIQHGVTDRAELIIPETERDSFPLDCNGETFSNTGTLQNWVDLY